jgi:HPt (histidine-containing phosphotransfer) domain-containing protein
MSGERVLDWEEALSRFAGDRKYLKEAVGCFLVDLEGHLREFRRAISLGEESTALGLARVIGTDSAKIGARALAEAARRCCEIKEDGGGAAKEVEEEVRRLRDHLRLGS